MVSGLDEKGKRVEGKVVNSILSGGSVVHGAKVTRSVLSNDVYIGPEAIVEDSVLLQGVRVGSRARIRRAIIDQDVSVPDGFSIGYDAENDKKLFSISPGKVVAVPRGISLGRGAKG